MSVDLQAHSSCPYKDKVATIIIIGEVNNDEIRSQMFIHLMRGKKVNKMSWNTEQESIKNGFVMQIVEMILKKVF